MTTTTYAADRTGLKKMSLSTTRKTESVTPLPSRSVLFTIAFRNLLGPPGLCSRSLFENNVGAGNTSSDAVHEPLSSAQVVEGFDGSQRKTYTHAAHAEIVLSRKREQGTCWIAIPVHSNCLVRTTY
jgi:hypothetical protein